MLLNVHSYYSLRYGTLSIEQLIGLVMDYGYDTIVLTDINNSTGSLDFISLCQGNGLNGLVGIEFRNRDKLLYIGIAKNEEGFKELNDIITSANLSKTELPVRAPEFKHVFVVYPFETIAVPDLREYEYVGIRQSQLNKLWQQRRDLSKYVIWQAGTFKDKAGYKLHCQLRAIDHNILLSQLVPEQMAAPDELILPRAQLIQAFATFPQLIGNTERLLAQCRFSFDFKTSKNRASFTGNKYDDLQLLEKYAYDGLKDRYGLNNKVASQRMRRELDIIKQLNFGAYFLITHDIVSHTMRRGFYHVGRGSGANSIVAYCLRITDVCPIELDLYFERFLNPKRNSPPDFDIDYSWDQRDEVYDYIFKRYKSEHVALLGAMSTFKDKSIIRELGKVYGLPKSDIDRIIDEPNHILNKHEITDLILSVYSQLEDFPNLRTIHASGVLISDLPITNYCALDLPPKNLPTAQFDMHIAEDIGFEKFDILSQRGIGHIKEAAKIIEENRGVKVDVHAIQQFKDDVKIQEQLKTGDTIGSFYIESPAMRGLIKKLKCSTYIILVAASSIIRPGVAKSGMMRAYIQRFHNPDNIDYIHPVMAEQLAETFGVMVYQEDVLKVCYHFFGLALEDGDIVRRIMTGKKRDWAAFQALKDKAFNNTVELGRPLEIAHEVWRQIESFAGYSFSKAHSASFAVESFQSLFLKTYYPIEFMVAVINNFGGFYRTWVYVNEARKAGGNIHLPCVNDSQHYTSLNGKDIHLGFIHVVHLENQYVQLISVERIANGPFTGLEDFIRRTAITLEQLIVLIRVGAFRFMGKQKKQLLWDAHMLLSATTKDNTAKLFQPAVKSYRMPQFESGILEDAYDELEFLGFTVSVSMFDMLKTDYRGDILAKDLINYVGKKVRMLGLFVTSKHVPTIKKELMKFGTFIDHVGDFFDTTHFPQSLQKWPLGSSGVYLIYGKVVEEFGFPSIEVEKVAKLPIKPDPRNA